MRRRKIAEKHRVLGNSRSSCFWLFGGFWKEQRFGSRISRHASWRHLGLLHLIRADRAIEAVIFSRFFFSLYIKAGTCWLTVDRTSGRCQDMLAMGMSQQDCCSSGRVTAGWTHHDDISSGQLFYWRALVGGAPDCQACQGTSCWMCFSPFPVSKSRSHGSEKVLDKTGFLSSVLAYVLRWGFFFFYFFSIQFNLPFSGQGNVDTLERANEGSGSIIATA